MSISDLALTQMLTDALCLLAPAATVGETVIRLKDFAEYHENRSR